MASTKSSVKAGNWPNSFTHVAESLQSLQFAYIPGKIASTKKRSSKALVKSLLDFQFSPRTYAGLFQRERIEKKSHASPIFPLNRTDYSLSTYLGQRYPPS
jgi:hypothetical protein